MIRRPAGLVLALAAASAGGVQSWVKVHQWDRSDVPVRFRLALQESNYSSAAAEALDAWNRAGADFSFTSSESFSEPAVGCSADASRLAIFAARTCGGEFPSGTLAVTSSWLTESGRVVDSDVLFNTGYSWDVYGGPLRSGAQDLRRVALHEFGHVLGLDHPDHHGQTRRAVMNAHVSDLDALQTDDVNGVIGIYGPASGGGVCSLEDLGLLTGRLVRSGSLGNDCVSPNHTGEFSRFYTFRLREAADVRIDVRSAAFDAYLELRAGADVFGELLAFDDDGGSGPDARIERRLSAGTYTIEATSYGVGMTGPFTLTAR